MRPARRRESHGPLCLLDVVAAVQDSTRDDREAVAALRHLLGAGRRRGLRRRAPARRARGLIGAVTLGLCLCFGARPSSAQDTDPSEQPPPPAVTQPEPAPEPLPKEQVHAVSEAAANEEATGFTFLPSRAIFDPLLADPQWPRFAAAYQAYHNDPELRNVANVAFGGMLPVFQGDLPREGRWEIGAQAGVFSIFDMDGQSFDLINTDFWIGLPVSARWGWFSSILRVYHQSSHLGDEFLLRTRVNRINLSYEAVDLIPSFDLWDWGRVYLGGGYLFHREPSDLKRKYVLAGAELKSPVAFGGWLRPVAAFDAHRREEQSWRTDYSARLGFQFENAKVFKSRRLLLLGEYYKGRSPNGQFFERRIEYFGVGLHFFF